MRIRAILTIALVMVWQPLWAATLQNNGDGTASDLVTALTWQRQADNVTRTHAVAVTYCEDLSLGGNNNWRLPTIKELTSIVDYRVRSPSIDETVFPNSNSSGYWSASSVASNSANAWSVYFNNGNVYSSDKAGSNYARCMR